MILLFINRLNTLGITLIIFLLTYLYIIKRIIYWHSQEGNYISNGKNAYINYDTKIDSGKIFKRNDKYRYYTHSAFDQFFPMDTISVNLKIQNPKKEVKIIEMQKLLAL